MEQAEDKTYDKIEQGFRESGFLSGELSPIREHLRSRFHDWFDLAEKLNRLAHKIYVTHSKLLGGREVFDPVQLGLQMFPRALGFFQGAVLLCPYGMGTEAQALVRIVFETNFWIGYLAEEGAEAAEVLRQAGLYEKIKLHKEVLNRWDTLGEHLADIPESIEKLEQARGDSRVVAPDMATLSTKSGFHQHYVLYRDLSGGSVHTSLASIQDYLWIDEDGFHRGHAIGPNEDEARKALSLGCLALFGTLQAIHKLTNDDTFEEEIGVLWEKFEGLYDPVPSKPGGE